MLLALLTAGCGFHMQGALEVPAAMQSTYVATDDRYSLFYRKLRRELETSGVQLVDAPANSIATLTIHQDETGQRVLSVSARNVPTEFEVFYTVEYSIGHEDSTLLDRRSLTLTRDYTYDETLVLGKAREEQVLRNAIADDLVRIVLKQIGTL